ncbi:MAG TPA: PQQ-dependent sugar dehydrogenase [Candidatus Kapabacteria bacterium]|nr:PQQ-dependent sugar dehydrogenase [Candidatus Kapabacteria bacterium]
MKKILLVAALFVLVLGVAAYRYGRGLAPALLPAPNDIANQGEGTDILPDAENHTDLPLTLPRGFAISILAKDLSGVRVLAQDHQGNLWVSRTNAGIISKITMQDGNAVAQTDIWTGLRQPHGITFDLSQPNVLYIAEEHQLTKANTETRKREKILDIPVGGRHKTRTLHYGSDGQLYISIGSTCDVCVEKDSRHGTIMRVDLARKVLVPYATGLRNAVFLTTNPIDGAMWATEMGRDFLGDDLPPDEVNIIEAKDYGWPVCFGKNIHDTDFDKKTYIQNPCNGKQPSHIDLPAHSAPLGIAFIPEEGWPEDYRLDLLVAYHGSWNRTVPAGYKIVRIQLDDKGNVQGEEDFISGWLSGNRSVGRPVDLLAMPGGVVYSTDDKAGVIYKIWYRGEAMAQADHGCFRTGCNNEVCGDSVKETDCTVVSHYVCNDLSICERQANGQCGWTETDASRQCLEDDYPPFILTENVETLRSRIRVTNITPNSSVSNDLIVEGEADSDWYDEERFNVRLVDSKGRLLSRNEALAVGKKKANGMIPFRTEIVYEYPETQLGYLLLEEHNPTRMPKFGEILVFPVTFHE